MFEVLAIQGQWLRFVCVVESFTSHEDLFEPITKWLNIVIEDSTNIELIYASTENWEEDQFIVYIAYTYKENNSKFGNDHAFLVRSNDYRKSNNLPS